MNINEGQLLTAHLTLSLAVLGAAMGSALACAVWRIRRGESWVKGQSKCASCGHTLAARDLIPVLSYVLAHGRCRYCRSRIPSECLWAELSGAAAFALLGWHFGWSGKLGMWLGFAGILLAASLVDVQERILPDKLLLAAAVNRVVWLFVLREPPVETLKTAALSALLPVSLLLFVLAYEKVRGVEAMGGGDLKLLLVMALYLDWTRLLLSLLAACILGLAAAAGKWKRAIPFGPALSAGCVLSATALSPWAAWYAGLF